MANYEETSSNFTHDVFLISSPNGNSKTFTDYIYQALLDSKITTVRYSSDEDITTTMEKCRISMVVLCENYAYSTKCLDELVKIFDSYDTKRKEVCVIFYKVEPSDVWFQKNCYERSLIEHEKSLGRDSETVKGWRMALSRICDLGGQHCKEDKYESGYIRKIVKDTSAKLPPPVPSEIKHPIGLDSRFEQLKSLIDIEPNNPVCMLGIYGEAGIGKTTLASYLYNKIRHQFEVASFLTNIREKSNNNNIIDLKDLQRTLLYETVKETQTVVETTFEGHSQIKDKLRHKRVLLILDDVNSIEQLKALAGGCDWFGSGSRIIITTRVEIETEPDKHHASIRKYKMKELNSCESLELFCWYVFNMSKPFDNYADICNDVVSYSKGIPRALKALGSKLKGLSIGEWKMELEKYENVPNSFPFLVDSL